MVANLRNISADHTNCLFYNIIYRLMDIMNLMAHKLYEGLRIITKGGEIDVDSTGQCQPNSLADDED